MKDFTKSNWLPLAAIIIAISCLFILPLAIQHRSSNPVILERNEWTCTKLRTQPVGMAMTEVCDQWTRKDEH